MKVEQAKAIYRQRYADPMRFNDLPSGVDYTVLDYAINSGLGRSGKVLRRVVGLPDTTP
jgi:lysozyme family protein